MFCLFSTTKKKWIKT